MELKLLAAQGQQGGTFTRTAFNECPLLLEASEMDNTRDASLAVLSVEVWLHDTHRMSAVKS